MSSIPLLLHGSILVISVSEFRSTVLGSSAPFFYSFVSDVCTLIANMLDGTISDFLFKLGEFPTFLVGSLKRFLRSSRRFLSRALRLSLCYE